ncbi:MAG: sarcosine oxidase subunit gamma [Alphaproteobacteria bacterium]|nr:sarcosine oxidase subunit gamma [Alphaproteobacteria bacterium]
MTEKSLRRAPLEGLAEPMKSASGPRVSLREIAFLDQVEVRGDPANPDFLQAVRGAIGFDLPLIPNGTTQAGGRVALWLGPDNWLLTQPEDGAGNLARALGPALAGLRAALVDVGAARAVLELTGPKARQVLLKGCGLDLHPRTFVAGQCAQSNLARAQILLMQTDALPTYRLHVRPSFGPYLVAWLLDAMTEYA